MCRCEIICACNMSLFSLGNYVNTKLFINNMNLLFSRGFSQNVVTITSFAKKLADVSKKDNRVQGEPACVCGKAPSSNYHKYRILQTSSITPIHRKVTQ